MPEKKNNEKFDYLINRFEEIVKILEKGELELEQAIELYEEGVKLQKLCEKVLHQAEMKIEKLVQGDKKVHFIPAN